MWTYDCSAETSARPDVIFDLFRDVSTWPRWNAGVESMDLDGPFVAGTTGTMKVPGQDPMRMRLTAVDTGRGFEDETEIPGAGVVVRVRHALTVLDNGRTRIDYGATIDGPAADTLGPIIGPDITADFPSVLTALIAEAEAATSQR
ncbi:MAG: SRPBCC family protein [Candidatus Dormibacteria bacterium]|jgi:polyketide cyclase/dehydrase/lipid transport protein